MDLLLKDLKESKEQLLSVSNTRLEVLCKRLIKIVNTRIQYYNKYNYYNEEKKNIFNPNIILKENNNLLFKKKIITSNRIKELVNIKKQILKEKENSHNFHNSEKFFNLTYVNSENRKNLFNLKDTNYSYESKFAKTH